MGALDIAIHKPGDVATQFGISERALRRKARELGACRIIGRKMLLLDEDVQTIRDFYYPDRARAERAETKLAGIQEERRQQYFKRSNQQTHRGYVYFLQCENHVKIGFAKDVGKRIRGIQTMCPTPPTLLGSYPATRSHEKDLHDRFEAYRSNGEWYRLNGPVAEYVADVIDGRAGEPE